MLSQEYLKLTLSALVVSGPVICFFINQWLNNFAYHIDIAWWMFVLPGIVVLIVALATVSILSIQTAVANPASRLRNEYKIREKDRFRFQ